MHYVQLNQGNKIPQLGLGVYQTADGQQTMDAVCWALEAGYRHIDTAKIYGNEKSVGDAIRASKIPRQQIFLTTKLWNDDIRAGRTEEAFNESLAALQTDYIDLYLIHWPAEGFTEAWTAMEKLYKQGRIRPLGSAISTNAIWMNWRRGQTSCLPSIRWNPIPTLIIMN